MLSPMLLSPMLLFHDVALHNAALYQYYLQWVLSPWFPYNALSDAKTMKSLFEGQAGAEAAEFFIRCK